MESTAEVPFSIVVIPAAMRRSLSVPNAELTKKCGTSLPRVNTWTTPPIASEPQRLESGPFTTSMRSMSSIGMFSIEVVPTVAEPTRMPSTSTSVCAVPAPRMKRPCGWPGPPVARSSMPA
jgi:hypothetical protein